MNPNLTNEIKVGPTTEIGKLKNSVSRRKYFGKGGRYDVNNVSRITKLMQDAGVDFSKAAEAIKARNLFEIFLKSKSVDELTEIARLDQVINILDTDMAMRTMQKLEKGIFLNDADIRLIRLLKECLQASHELRFGKKTINLTADLQDIRELMFGEQK